MLASLGFKKIRRGPLRGDVGVDGQVDELTNRSISGRQPEQGVSFARDRREI